MKNAFEVIKLLTIDDYQKVHQDMSSFFALGAPNRSGTTIETMDKRLLALNYFSYLISALADSESVLEKMAVGAVIGKAFQLGNCERQARTSIMYLLTRQCFTKSLELISIDGTSLFGSHRFVLIDRELTCDLNQVSTWHGATYFDTWSGELLSGESLTSLTKEELAAKGGMTGDITMRSSYRRETILSLKECQRIIKCLKEFSRSITVSMITYIRISSRAIDYLREIDDEQIVHSIQRQIDEDIASYAALYPEILAIETGSGAASSAQLTNASQERGILESSPGTSQGSFFKQRALSESLVIPDELKHAFK